MWAITQKTSAKKERIAEIQGVVPGKPTDFVKKNGNQWQRNLYENVNEIIDSCSRECPEKFVEALKKGFPHDGPALIEVVTSRQELSMPPTIELKQALGFSLYMAKAVINGRGDKIIDLAKTNLLRWVARTAIPLPAAPMTAVPNSGSESVRKIVKHEISFLSAPASGSSYCPQRVMLTIQVLEWHGNCQGVAATTNIEVMKTYYAIVNVKDRRLGTYVSAENVAAAFKTATARYKTRHPRLHVETIAVQEMAKGGAGGSALYLWFCWKSIFLRCYAGCLPEAPLQSAASSLPKFDVQGSLFESLGWIAADLFEEKDKYKLFATKV
jgi:hypothetical protein